MIETDRLRSKNFCVGLATEETLRSRTKEVLDLPLNAERVGARSRATEGASGQRHSRSSVSPCLTHNKHRHFDTPNVSKPLLRTGPLQTTYCLPTWPLHRPVRSGGQPPTRLCSRVQRTERRSGRQVGCLQTRPRSVSLVSRPGPYPVSRDETRSRGGLGGKGLVYAGYDRAPPVRRTNTRDETLVDAPRTVLAYV